MRVMPVFKTGAFLQQCFAVHPLALSVKVLRQPDKIGVLCAHCNMRHRLTGKTFHVQVGSDVLTSQDAPKSFEHCVAHHPEELRIGAVDISQESVQLRCKTCQRSYIIDVVLFETHQP